MIKPTESYKSVKAEMLFDLLFYRYEVGVWPIPRLFEEDVEHWFMSGIFQGNTEGSWGKTPQTCAEFWAPTLEELERQVKRFVRKIGASALTGYKFPENYKFVDGTDQWAVGLGFLRWRPHD